MATLGFDNTIKAGVSSRPILPNADKTMLAVTNYQLDQKHDPPFSTDHPLKLEDFTPMVTYQELQEIKF